MIIFSEIQPIVLEIKKIRENSDVLKWIDYTWLLFRVRNAGKFATSLNFLPRYKAENYVTRNLVNKLWKNKDALREK